MGVPEQTNVASQQALHQQPTSENAVVPVEPYAAPAPPSYEKHEEVQTAGVPRNDDPAKAEKSAGGPIVPPAGAMVVPLHQLHQTPAAIDCPFCKQRTMTRVHEKESDTTWLYTLLCCLFCGCIGAIFPIALKWAADFEHFCTNCKNRVARVPHEGGSGNQQTQVFAPQTGVPSQHQPGQHQ